MNFYSTTISEQAITEVNKTLKSGLISAGKKADELENILANDFSLINPVTLNSGTSTLHLALKAAGIKEGDEVILPAQTFIATGFAILYCGAKPVFCDINLYDGNMDVISLVDKITPKTKAIMCVHWAGYPCDMDRINKIAKEFNLMVIEDAAHAFGAKYKNKVIGDNTSNFTSFSFQAIKHVTSGDGGILCCKNKEHELLVKKLRWFDIDRENSKPDLLGERVYDATNIGYKYHMNDLSASLAIGNLNTIDIKLERLRYIAKRYFTEIKKTHQLKFMNYQEDRVSSYWLFPLIVMDRTNFIKKMKNHGIPVSVVHLGIDKNTIFGGKDYTLSNQRFFDDHQIHIPINDELTDEDVDLIIKTINEGW